MKMRVRRQDSLNRASSNAVRSRRAFRRSGSSLPACGPGEAADTYDQAAERRLREIRKIQDELSRLAHTIRKAADEFEAAEARTKASMSASGGMGSGGGGEW